MAHKTNFVRKLYIPVIAIVVANVLGGFYILPIFIQLLLNSSAVVYIGVIVGSQIKQTEKGYRVVSGDSEE